MDAKRRKKEESVAGVKNNIEQIYMDYNATTPLAPSVIAEINDSLTTAWGNPSSSYNAGVQAKCLIENSRKNLLKMLNGKEVSEIIFMSGGTEANNHAIQSCILGYQDFVLDRKGSSKPHIITTIIEHPSVINLIKHFEERQIINVSYIKVSKSLGYINPEDVVKEIRDETVLITIMLANNETGAIQPLQEICRRVHDLESLRKDGEHPPIFVHTDAAQAIGKIKVDVQELGVDYLTVAGHKFYGPRIGALWTRSHASLYPLLYGGGQEMGKRAGTENTCMIAGLGEAARLVVENLYEYNRHFEMIRCYLKEKLRETFGDRVLFNGAISETLPNTLNISMIGDVLQGRRVLSTCKILQASVGAACHSDMGDRPSSILLAHGVSESTARNAIRLSVGRETTKEHIDCILKDLKFAVDVLSP